jgi:hypothetical protein
LIQSKEVLPELHFLKKKYMVVRVLKNGTTFSIETSLDSKWISNAKSEKLLGLEFDRI